MITIFQNKRLTWTFEKFFSLLTKIVLKIISQINNDVELRWRSDFNRFVYITLDLSIVKQNQMEMFTLEMNAPLFFRFEGASWPSILVDYPCLPWLRWLPIDYLVITLLTLSKKIDYSLLTFAYPLLTLAYPSILTLRRRRRYLVK